MFAGLGQRVPLRREKQEASGPPHAHVWVVHEDEPLEAEGFFEEVLPQTEHPKDVLPQQAEGVAENRAVSSESASRTELRAMASELREAYQRIEKVRSEAADAAQKQHLSELRLVEANRRIRQLEDAASAQCAAASLSMFAAPQPHPKCVHLLAHECAPRGCVGGLRLRMLHR